MPDHLKQQAVNCLSTLDACLAANDPKGAMACCERFDELSRQSVHGFGPRWLKNVIKDKGIRLPALEHALDVDKVVITGDLKFDVLDALKGKNPVKGGKIELRIEF